MEYKLEVWTLKKLYDQYKLGKLNLNPPYQRKFIWSLNDQQTLIDSILNGFAIPNLFLYQRAQTEFEMVDGQQRTRTILNFIDGGIETVKGEKFNKVKNKKFLQYQIPVTIITRLEEGEIIENFYSLVNKSGIHLNRPELKKAEFFDSNVLKLANQIADLSSFKELDLFSDSTSKRMNDIDFITEIITLLNDGISDKKIKVDKLFEKDITDIEYKKIHKEFVDILNVFSSFNAILPIKKTRYRQRNDFYSLAAIIKEYYKELDTIQWDYVYNLLVKFNDNINPSNDKCEPFQEYAFNCISQSNSKNARDIRNKILTELFFNLRVTANKRQKQVWKFYGKDVKSESLVTNGKYFTFKIESL